MSDQQRKASSIPGQLGADQRPARMLALFTARKMTHAEVPRLVEFCSQAYREETPGASLKLLPPEEGQPENIFRIEATPGMLLKESEILLRLHDIDDPQSDHPAILAHFAKLDEELGQIAKNSVEGAQSYVALVGTRLLQKNRIDAFLNLGALTGSALGALFIDPAAVMVTTDPGEWAEACEQSLSIEGAMASLKSQ